MKKLSALLFFTGLLSLAVHAQVEVQKNEIGIDVANAMTFIKRNQQSYLLNYRRNFNEKMAFRAGLNLDLGSGNSEGIYPDIKAGIQRNRREGHWNLYYGIDGTFSYFKSNASPAKLTRFGISPILGVQYFIHKRISISTEASLNFNYYKPRNPESFDPEANKNYYRIFIGSVGMVLISYHFD